MTLVLNCLTDEYVIQVADRRLTDYATGTLVDDEACKAVVVGRRAVVAYTGLAALKPGGRAATDLWLVDQLLGGSTLQHSLERLAAAATERFRLIAHLQPHQKGHAFVMAGWSDAANGPRPFLATVSNSLDPAGKWQDRPRDAFTLHIDPLRFSQGLRVRAVGQDFTPQYRGLLRQLRGQLRANLGPGLLVSTIANAVREVAAGNRAVGSGLLVTFLPRQAASRSGGFLLQPMGAMDLDGDLRLDPATPTALYVPSASSKGRIYAPHYIDPTIAMADVTVHPYAMTPEEVRRRYAAGLRRWS